jgi:hypothetical protein
MQSSQKTLQNGENVMKMEKKTEVFSEEIKIEVEI